MSKAEKEKGSQITWLSSSDPRLYHTFLNGFRVQARLNLDAKGTAVRVVSVFFDCTDGTTLSASGTSNGEIDALVVALAAKLRKLLDGARTPDPAKKTPKEEK